MQNKSCHKNNIYYTRVAPTYKIQVIANKINHTLIYISWYKIIVAVPISCYYSNWYTYKLLKKESKSLYKLLLA